MTQSQPSTDLARRPLRRLARRPVLIGLALLLATGLAALSWAWLRTSGESRELAERDRLRTEIAELFETGRFDEIEVLATRLRDSRARTASGVWQLTVLYSAFGRLAATPLGDEAGWRRIAHGMESWLAAHPQSPTAIIAEAIVLRRSALRLKPSGYLLQASLGASDPYKDALRSTLDFLEARKQTASHDPHYYVVWAELAAATGTDPDSFIAEVEEGFAREPGYYQLYFAALDYFTSSRDEALARDIETLANTAVARTAATDGLGVYARLYWYAANSHFGASLFKRSAADWPRLRQGIDDVLARYPDPWNVNSFAYLACLAGDREKTRELIDRLEGEPIVRAWKSQAAFETCKAFAVG
ncbi:MAG: hypothetical protein R3D33_09575 [Hyphomicrobiaceae bacterium]